MLHFNLLSGDGSNHTHHALLFYSVYDKKFLFIKREELPYNVLGRGIFLELVTNLNTVTNIVTYLQLHDV